jgi:hypothetical protein
MTPFQQVRLWGRRAPLGERVSAAAGALLALAVVAYLVVPPESPSRSSSLQSQGTTVEPGTAEPLAPGTTGSAAPGSRGATGPAPSGVRTGAVNGTTGAQTGGGSGAGSTRITPGGGCLSPPGSDQGVSAKQIKVAIILFEISGSFGNEALALPPADVQQRAYQIVADSINAGGGVACRKLVPVFFRVNPLDQSDLQQKCLQIAEAGVLMAIDGGSYTVAPALLSCFPQHGVPIYEQLPIAESLLTKNYPYMFAQGSLDQLYRNSVFALKQRGFFSAANGFGKLGYYYGSCNPDIPNKVESWLHQAGIPAGDIVSFDQGCSTTANPANDQQAVLTFQRAHVTHVFQTQANWSGFTSAAQQQGFHPKYGFPDDPVVAVTYGTNHPDYSNLADALVITSERIGEERTPGYVPSRGTARCNAIMRAHGEPPVYQQQLGMGGFACDHLWEFVAMVEHAPSLKRASLALGLQATKTIDFSYPLGPPAFSGRGVTVGGQSWRTEQFFTSCNCWRVIDRTFHPAFG